MIRPASEPDWFVIDPTAMPALSGSPGLRLHRGVYIVHRSQLPILAEQDPSILQWIDKRSDPARWILRDQLTEPLGFKLRTHQQVGVDFTSERRGSLIADEPRVGKTLSGIMSHDPNTGPLVVICPLIVREVWVSWLKKRFPTDEIDAKGQPINIGIMTGKTFDPGQAARPIVIGHYDIVSNWQSNQTIGTIIFDEAHVLSNAKSRRTHAAAFLASRAKKVLALTGTPLWNKPYGLFPILNIVAPGSFGSHRDFGFRYCGPEPTAHGTKFDRTSNEVELQRRLTEIMICRKWRDVAKDLPTVTRDIYIAEVSPSMRFDIDVAAEAIRDPSAKTTTAGSLARYRKVLGDVKLKASIEATRNVLDRDLPVVVWTWHKSVASQLLTALQGKDKSQPKAFLITGETPIEKREQIFIQWRAHPAAALIMTIAAGQVGIDLSHAHIAIFAEIDFTPAMVAQAEMRTYSPMRSMNVTYIVADHIVDRRIISALQRKLEAGDRLGVPAAEAAIDVLRTAFSVNLNDGDLDRLMLALLEEPALD